MKNNNNNNNDNNNPIVVGNPMVIDGLMWKPKNHVCIFRRCIPAISTQNAI